MTMSRRWWAGLLTMTLVSAGAARAQAPNVQLPTGYTLYYLGLMTRGTGTPPAGFQPQTLLAAHIASVGTMVKDGLLLGSGPITDQGALRGVYIFRNAQKSVIEARVNQNPMFSSGYMKMTLKPWAGPVGVGVEYLKWLAANPGTLEKPRTLQLVLFRPAPGAPTSPTPDDERLQREHLTGLNALAKRGALASAGAILERGDLAGILVFTVGPSETDALVAADPTVKAGRMVGERHTWLVPDGVFPVDFTAAPIK